MRRKPAGAIIDTLQLAFRDDFPGAALDPTKWDPDRRVTGPGMTITVAASALKISTGTTANSETIIPGLVPVSMPFRAGFCFYLTQRIVNQEFYFEVTNRKGDMVARWKLDGTTATSGLLNVGNGGTFVGDQSVTSMPSSASYSILEIQPTVDEVAFFSKAADSVSGKVTGHLRNRLIPDPNEEYFLQVRVKNLATPPASNTDLYIDFVTLQDYTEVAAELVGGQGNPSTAQAVPVFMTGFGSSMQVQGIAAHDAVASGNPARIGVKAKNTVQANVSADGDVVDLTGGLDGILTVRQNAVPQQKLSYTGTVSTATDTPVFAAAGAGISNALTWLLIQNTHATVVQTISIKDGATVKATFNLPAAMAQPIAIPLPAEGLSGSANTALNITTSAAGTVIINALGFKHSS